MARCVWQETEITEPSWQRVDCQSRLSARQREPLELEARDANKFFRLQFLGRVSFVYDRVEGARHKRQGKHGIGSKRLK